jgi:hypothetical protein
MALRRTVGPKRDIATGGWRILHSVDLRNLYSSPNVVRLIKSRKIKRTEHAALLPGVKCIRDFVIKQEGKKLLGRSRHRCEDNIIVDIKEIR